ncbi:MAG: cation:proton antiporter, partial [Vibrio sp.]
MELLVFIIVAFSAGFLALKCKLPPLVGFLLAGFGLRAYGYETTPTIEGLASLGVTLLLFTIGLKLDVKTLLKKEIWLSSSLHNIATTCLFTFALIALKYLGLSMFQDLEWSQLALLGFALSFSSTVFAIKSLEERGTMNANYAKIAIGILVMQDIFAVIFLTASTGKLPHWTAIFLFLLPLCRPLFYRVMEKSGHGEMLVLYGFFMALVMGGGLFSLVGMKPDLGALIL